MKDELGLKSIMQVPRIAKITLNMGVGEAKNDAKQLDQAIEELTTIAGQRAQVRKSTQVGCAVQDPRGHADRREGDAPRSAHVRVPRPARLDRVAAHPRLPRAQPRLVRRPRQLFARVREQIIFPEINYDDVKEVRGLDVTITTTAETDDHARALLLAIGLPFSGEGERRDQ